MKHKVIGVEWLSDDYYTIELERNDVCFEPGACASIGGRTYSIGSSPNQLTLSFYIRRIPGGEVSDQLHTKKPGDHVEITEIHAYFAPGKDCNDQKYVYIATGTGISPFMSALQCYEHSPHIILLGVKTNDDAHALIEDEINEQYNFRFATSQEGSKQHVQDALEQWIPIEKDFKYFICGAEGMISDVSNHLIKKGVQFDQISTEQFFY